MRRSPIAATGRVHAAPMHGDGAATREALAGENPVHLFHSPTEPDAIECYSHYERRPDLVSPSISLERIRTHYRPGWGEYSEGVACADLERYVD